MVGNADKLYTVLYDNNADPEPGSGAVGRVVPTVVRAKSKDEARRNVQSIVGKPDPFGNFGEVVFVWEGKDYRDAYEAYWESEGL